MHATADGALVVCHDATVDRTTNGAGPIADADPGRAQAARQRLLVRPRGRRRARAATRDYPLPGPGPRGPRFRVATLDEVLDARRASRGGRQPRHQGRRRRRWRPTRRRSPRCCAGHGHSTDVIVASFLDAATARVRRRCAPAIATSAGHARPSAEFWRALHAGRGAARRSAYVALQVPADYGDSVLVDERFVDVAHERGLAVHVWTINDEPRWSARSTSGSTGSSRTCRRPWSACSTSGACAWSAGRLPSGGRSASAAAGVRPLAVVRLLLARSLRLLVRFDMRGKATAPAASARPGVSRGSLGGRWSASVWSVCPTPGKSSLFNALTGASARGGAPSRSRRPRPRSASPRCPIRASTPWPR